MRVAAADTFEEQLEKIRDASIVKRAEKAVEKLKVANTLREVTNVKPMKGYSGFYRLSFGNYRIGFYYIEEEQTVELLAIDHRDTIYRAFPGNFA